MSVTSGFFNSLKGDRRYNAEQMSALFDGLINDGVFANIGDTFAVNATTGNEITVGIGRAWFNSAWIYNDSVFPITARDSESLLDRIDAVIIEMNHSESVRSGSIKIIEGSPSNKPAKPEMLHRDGVNQYPLAYIYRKAGSASITQGDITNMIGTSDCPFVTGILEVTDIDLIVAQWENQFKTWFKSLDDILDENVAVNLANQILELDARFTTLAKDHAVYTALEDSDGNIIKANDESEIEGRTIFISSDAKSSDESNPIYPEDAYKIGDTLTTARIDLGNNWVLCNGMLLDRNEYPIFSDLVPKNPNTLWNTKSIIQHTADVEFDSIHYINGKYILCGCRRSGNTSQAIISYSADVNGPWETKILWTYSNAYGARCTSITYGNGYYVACGQDGYDSPSGCIAYSSSLDGEWTKKTIMTSEAAKLFDIIYENEKFVAIGRYVGSYAQAVICYSTDSNPSSSWRSDYMWRDAAGYYRYVYPNRIFYIQGKYVAVGRDANSAVIAYSDTPDGEWTYKEIWSGANNTGGTVAYDLIYDGKYIVCGSRLSSSSEKTVPVIAYADTLDGEWTTISINNDVSSSLIRLFYENSIYTAFDNNGSVFYSKNVDTEWFYKESIFGFAGYSRESSDAMFDELTGEYIVCGESDKSNDYNASISISDSSKITLPLIAISDSAYTYIKVKEG